ncbi:MAG: PilZ domain-containing protein [Desulfobacula sp.]|nr:PilZ domain-containing protein [Desulfobacula sp.]
MEMLDEIIKRVRNLNSDQQVEILGLLKTWQTGRQRDYPRLDTKVNIDVVVGDRVIQTDAKDISAGGIFINTSGKFQANEKVRVVFTIPGSDKPFKLEGMIVRVEQNGMAIKFEKITPYFKKMLDEIIWDNKNPEGEFL